MENTESDKEGHSKQIEDSSQNDKWDITKKMICILVSLSVPKDHDFFRI